ncbi:MAG: ribonuclease III [Deltaproteobacteria bacterium]|nr:ribonuclease III [Deltaproteobacteria bacterium]
MDKDRLKVLQDLQKRLAYNFRDSDLLSTALTHRSYVNENQHLSLSDNERLEFLGDSVLGACVSDLIIKKYAASSEGELTKTRSALVGEKNLAQLARNLRIGDCLLIGRGEENAGSRDKDSFLANAFEAVVAAVYLDAGFNSVNDVINKLIEPLLEGNNLPSDYFDYKTALQELCQKRYKTTPIYIVVDSTGPEHARIFEVRVVIINKLTEYGSGKSKKEAEKQAAQKAWEALQNEED